MLEIANESVAADGRRCRRAGLRAITDRRWYLDLACDDGSRFDLDINRRDVDTLLIAARPLGEAFFFKRSDATRGQSRSTDQRR